MTVNDDFYQKIISESQNEIILNGVVSTSFDKKIACKYSIGDENSIVFIFSLSKGINCIPTFLYAKHNEKEISFINLVLKIQNIYEENGITFIYAKC